MNQSDYKQIIKGILVADAYAMPFQWIYEKEKIDDYTKQHYSKGSFNSADHNSYYKGKKAGEQSHYGDQLLHLDRYITKAQKSGKTGFDLDDYKAEWKKRALDYPYFVDTSTKRAIEKGRDTSENFCGVSIATPLLRLSLDSMDEARALLANWISLAHDNQRIIDGMHYYLECLALVAQNPSYSLGKLFKEAHDRLGKTTISEFIDKSLELAESTMQDRELIYDQLGYGCDLTTNLPMSLVLGVRYGEDYEMLIQKNAELATDCCSKALFLGAIGGLKHPDFFDTKGKKYLNALNTQDYSA